ncbi:branched-chain amino acid ABC transporter permease [Veronia nyctiphanis]|uniref:Branched-chain amino acid ABC transporter permease n=1 Tax=Veronia nyctiphanis TaxID=1278244 RepID=A0A4Q0YL56_9GAMM|nr:AzlC family ABC transporter permease [Veronia nyctiphanis]RXJ71502.1 branched-chain amino acid ABC transporter permease [Veronia nyctiphanis]
MSSQIEIESSRNDKAHSWHHFRRGALDASPLCLAVMPWGLLAGSFAIEAGLDPFQAQAMSAIVFAGAAQLAATGMMKADASLWILMMTTAIITSRHLLYSLSMRDRISPLPAKWRFGLGFLLTDELFAVTAGKPPEDFNRWYALGVGLWFYICWNVASFVGIVAGELIPNLENVGLEFAIAATFIAIVVPMVKNIPTLATVITALVLSVAFESLHVDGGMMIASVLAMVVGFFCHEWRDAL